MSDEKGLDFEAVRRLAAIEIFKAFEKWLDKCAYGRDNEYRKIKKKFGVE
jgi:hypothetical protein